MKLNNFTGGLNTRIDPSLINLSSSVVCTNVDMTSGPLKPVKLPNNPITIDGKYAHYYDAQDEWYASTTPKDYVEYQGKLYWTQDGTAQQYDGTTVTNMGIVQPADAPLLTAGGTGGQDGTYQYMYSYYNDNTGIESSVSPLSIEIALTGTAVTISYNASVDPQVTNIRIYRVGGTWTDFLLVATVTNVTGTYVDTFADEDLQGAVIGSSLNNAPPTGLRYLTESLGMFFGAVGTKLYYTKGDGYPQYWPAINYFELFEPITSIAAVTDGVLIFTRNSTHLLAGREAETFTLYPLDKSKGCISHAGTISTGKVVYLVGASGIYLATSSGVSLLSDLFLGEQAFDIVNAVMLNDVYYLQLTNGKILCYDRRYSEAGSFYYFDFASDAVATDRSKLYVVKGAKLLEVFGDGDATYSYKTGVITEGEYSNLKSYNKFYIRSNGTVTVSIYIDGELALTKLLTGNDLHEVTPPQALRRGYGLELEFSGTGIVYEVVNAPTFRE